MINEKLRDREFFDEVKTFYESHTGEQTQAQFGLTKKNNFINYLDFLDTKSQWNYKKEQLSQVMKIIWSVERNHQKHKR